MRRVFIVLILCALFVPASVCGEEYPFSLQAAPAAAVPLGSSEELYDFGAGVDLRAAYLPAWLSTGTAARGGVEAGAGFLTLPLESQDAIGSFALYGGPALRYPLGERFSLFSRGGAGYYYWYPTGWDAGDENGGGLLLTGGAGGAFRFTGSLVLGAELGYDYYHGLYNGMRVELALRYDFSLDRRGGGTSELRSVPENRPKLLDDGGEGLELGNFQLSPVFPALYTHYETHPIGHAVIRNYERRPAEDVSISFFVERYMDNPMELPPVERLEADSQQEIPLYGLLTEDTMQITEGTKASARVTLEYTLRGERERKEYSTVLEFHNRNALSWDDDRKVAAFITAKDPQVLALAKNVATWMRERENPSVDENLQKGMAIFEAIKALGIRYEVDPTTPFSEYSERDTAVDFLQFPRQTLQFTNGDCDDLSVLYASLLEALGVETALVTVPGHIFPALALDGDPDQVSKNFARADELIVQAGRVWIPVEITLCQDTFQAAWEDGAKQWREQRSQKQAKLYPTREAWQTYRAVGFREGGADLRLPDRETVVAAFDRSLSRHLELQIGPQETRLFAQIEHSSRPHKPRNKLAVLYARHGLYEKAEKILDEITARREYAPALINLGNIHFLRGDYERALGCYRRVLARDSGNTVALLGSARCNHEMENYGLVGESYEQLRRLAPSLASRYAYLDLRGEQANRAAYAADARTQVVWEEE